MTCRIFSLLYIFIILWKVGLHTVSNTSNKGLAARQVNRPVLLHLNFLVATSLVGHERELLCTHHQTCILHSQRQTQQSRPDVPFQQVDKGLTETAGGQKKSIQIPIHDILDWSGRVHSRHSRGSRPLSDPLVVTLRSGGPRRWWAESVHFWRVLVREQRTWGGREEEEEEWKIRQRIAVQTQHTLTTPRLQTDTKTILAIRFIHT